MSDKSGPNPPDYMGLANRSADLNWNLLNQQTWQNRPNMNTPYGSYSWTPPTSASAPDYLPPSQMATSGGATPYGTLPYPAGGAGGGSLPTAPGGGVDVGQVWPSGPPDPGTPPSSNPPAINPIGTPPAPITGGLRPILPVLGQPTSGPGGPTDWIRDAVPTSGSFADAVLNTGFYNSAGSPNPPMALNSGLMYAGGSPSYDETTGAYKFNAFPTGIGGEAAADTSRTAPPPYQPPPATKPNSGQRAPSDTDRWTYNVNLSPDQQAILDAQERMQIGRGDLALQNMGSASDLLRSRADWSSLPAAGSLSGTNLTTDVGTQAIQRSVPTRNLQTSVGTEAMQRSVPTRDLQTSVGTEAIQRSVPTQNLQTSMGTEAMQRSIGTQDLRRDVNPVDVQGAVGTEALQRGLDFGGAPSMPGVQAANQMGFDAAYGLAASRLDPQWQQREDQSRTRLYNMGLREGDAAFDTAMSNLGMDRNDAYRNAINQATLTGAGIGNQLFGQGLAARQQGVGELGQQGAFANQAAIDAFQQALSAGNFANSAAAQQFGQNLSRNQFANQAANDAFAQSMSAGNFANNAADRSFAQNLQAGQFGNQARNEMFSQALRSGDFANAAAQQAFGQNLAAGQFGNQARNEMFQQSLSAGNFANNAADRAFAQNLSAGQFGNQALNDMFSQGLRSGEFANTAAQQAFGQDLSRANFQNAAAGQQFGQNQALADFQNQLRQQGIAEMLGERSSALNEMMALQSGLTPGYPQQANFSNAGMGQAPDLMGAANAAYGAQLGQYNAGQAQMGGFLGGLANLAPFLF